MKKDKQISENNVRVVKISKNALFEFIYESFMEHQGAFLDVDPLQVTDTVDIDFERGEFIVCAYQSEDHQGNIVKLPDEIDLRQLMKNIPDTTATMYGSDRYKEYTKDELIALSKKKRGTHHG